MYQSILNYLPEALEKVEEMKGAGLAPGRYEYGGFFISVQRGTTKTLAEGKLEAHAEIRRYLVLCHILNCG